MGKIDYSLLIISLRNGEITISEFVSLFGFENHELIEELIKINHDSMVIALLKREITISEFMADLAYRLKHNEQIDDVYISTLCVNFPHVSIFKKYNRNKYYVPTNEILKNMTDEYLGQIGMTPKKAWEDA